MKKKFLSQATLVYLGCMQDTGHGGTSTVIEHVHKSNECDSVHHVCSEKEVFPECTIDGYFSIFPQIRFCKQCLAKGMQCLKAASIAYITDCEEVNQKAIEQILLSKQEKTIAPTCTLLHPMP